MHACILTYIHTHIVASSSGKLAKSGRRGSATAEACRVDAAVSTSGAFRLPLLLGGMARNCVQLGFCEAASLKAVKVPGIHLEPKNIGIYGHHWRLFPSESSSSLYHTCVNQRDRLVSAFPICSMAPFFPSTSSSIAPFSIYIVIISSSYMRKSEG